MTTIYSGALAPKKKQELVELASTLKIDDTGTKEALSERIKEHLASNQHLSNDARFAGLYGKRKASMKLGVKYVHTVITTDQVLTSWLVE